MVLGLSALLFIGVILVAVVLAFYAIGIYNVLIQLRNQYEKSWSNIDVLLKQRADMIPNLIETCRGYMQHERETLERVTQARSAWATAQGQGVASQIEASNAVSGALKSLFAVAEKYPDLKANQNFLQLQSSIESLENQIAERRSAYNTTVQSFNTRIEIFPDLIVARLVNYQKAPYFEIAEADKAVPKVSFSPRT